MTVVSGNGLKSYSVVVGSFSLKANAEGLQSTLKTNGYDAQIAFNSERNMYRVIASTFDQKGDAARSRDAFRANIPMLGYFSRNNISISWRVYFL